MPNKPIGENMENNEKFKRARRLYLNKKHKRKKVFHGKHCKCFYCLNGKKFKRNLPVEDYIFLEVLIDEKESENSND